jgi:hypothetical protein
MKTIQWLAIFILAIAFSTTAVSQGVIQYPAPSLELKIEQDGGRNGSAVVYNPKQELYYSVVAGNADFPLETFNKQGRNVYQSRAYNDMRGLWWNAKEKALEGNCYKDGGIVSFGMTDQGYAGTGNRIIFEGGNHQPSDHACGVYDPKKKEILYYNDGYVTGYSRKDGLPADTYLQLSIPVDDFDINYSNLIFTGEKKMEIGLLDINENKVYLFNKKTGAHTETVNLPSDAITYEAFNFSYANGYVFLFDQSDRKWTGYKIFD